MNKYQAKKVIVTADGTLFEVEQLKRFNLTGITGINFDSKAEAEYYLYLKQCGNFNIELQPIFVLQDKPKIKYIADFKVTDNDGLITIIDVKGMQTQAFSIKKRLFKAKYPDLRLTIVKKVGRKFVEVAV